MGAWIETKVVIPENLEKTWSRPAWARGLKHRDVITVCKDKTVAPRVGAWIETMMANLTNG